MICLWSLVGRLFLLRDRDSSFWACLVYSQANRRSIDGGIRMGVGIKRFLDRSLDIVSVLPLVLVVSLCIFF